MNRAAVDRGVVTRRIIIAVVAVTVLLSLSIGAQQPARDGARLTPIGTASISGVVMVSGDAPQPARRVRVTLTNVDRTSPGQTATTDDTGAFAFRALPAGRFELQAFKNGYLRGSYGASRPERAGTPIVLKDGESVANLAIAIARGGVITGRVRDSRGRPLAGMTVRVLRLGYSATTGGRTAAAANAASAGRTDDRGEYRAFGLPPGDYLVLLPGLDPRWAGSPGADDIRQLTASDVDRALQASSAGTRVSSPGFESSPSAAALPRVNYAPVFYPGVTDVGAASTVSLGLGEERGGVDITTQLQPVAIISGVVTAPSGALPSDLMVRLVPAGPQLEMLVSTGLRWPTSTVAADGTFAFGGVAPGAYTVKAATGGGRGGRSAAAPGGATLWASTDVQMTGTAVRIPLTLQPGITITGRLTFDGIAPTAAELTSLSIKLIPSASTSLLQAAPTATVSPDARLTLPSIVPDSYRFSAEWADPRLADRWMVKSSVANGRESLDAPLTVAANEAVDWTITFTDKPTALAGVFQNRSGRPATDFFILVVPFDRKFWTPGSRRVRVTRPASDGAFSVRGLPPDDYLVAALSDVEPGEWNDASFLDQLARAAVRVTLRAGETTRQDLRAISF